MFQSMENTYGIKPRYQHYACFVDMLARAGEIEQATGFIDQMPFEPEPSLWRVVLGACGKHRNIGIGRQVAEQLIQLEPYEATNYVLIANVYARIGRWAEAERIRNLMEERGLKKEEGVSWIEVKRKIYKFGVEDKSHPQSEEIYEKLRELMKEITAAGYEPDVSFTVHDMEEDRREESLWYHAEKLAFAFGVISTSKEVKIRIMKNLRICGDCHSAFKHFSLITKRKIVLRDKYRFHHFSGGMCSCGDYW
nr:pentatricopeptide repeat protein AaPPR639 [Agave angustifolia]